MPGQQGCYLRSYKDAALIRPGGSHRQMLSHVCLGARTGCERLTIDVHRYGAGAHSITNVHDNCEQVYIVIGGEGEATVSGQTRKVCEGSVVFIPRNAPHSIRSTGAGELTLVFVSVSL